MKRLSVVIVVLLQFVLPWFAFGQTTQMTPTCVANADGVTKTCDAEMTYDGVSKYAVAGSATDPVTGDVASFATSVLPLCQAVQVSYPTGKLHVKWVCRKDLTVSPFTATKQ